MADTAVRSSRRASGPEFAVITEPTNLGGHAHDLTADKMQITHGESPRDTAKVISMQDDLYHPLQGLTDLVTTEERFGVDVVVAHLLGDRP